MSYISMGLCLGAISDRSALVLTEDGDPFRVRHLQLWQPAIFTEQIVTDVLQCINWCGAFSFGSLVIECDSVPLRSVAPLLCSMAETFKVVLADKMGMSYHLKMLLDNRRLLIPKDYPEIKPALEGFILNMQAWRTEEGDDIALALMMSCWGLRKEFMFTNSLSLT